MIEFTKIEIGWIADAVKQTGAYYRQVIEQSTDNAERSLANLRAEQLELCEKKLRLTVDGGDKRMAIKY